MKRTSDEQKNVFVKNVIETLNRKSKKHEVKLINKQTDLTKRYKKSQVYVRENKEIFDGIDLYKTDLYVLPKGENGLYENDIVGETDEQFTDKICKADKSINVNANVAQIEKKQLSHLKESLFNEIAIKIKKEFIDKLEIDKELFGYKNGNIVYYCKEYDCLYEIV